MSDPDARMFWLRDQRLVSVALSSLPAWLWSIDASRILWANPIGAAVFGAPHAAALARRTFDLGQPAAAQIAEFAATMPMGSPRIGHLRGFGAGIGRTLACRCSRVMLEDGADALLVDALERSGPELPIGERAQRLLAECTQPVAIVSARGDILHGTPAALSRLPDGARALTFPGSEALIDEARRIAHAEGRTESGPITLDRIGAGDILSFVATFGPPVAGRETVPEVVTAPPKPDDEAEAEVPDVAGAPQPDFVAIPAVASFPSAPSGAAVAPSPHTNNLPEVPTGPRTAPEHRYPLRFVWQTDAEDRFAILSEEFLNLVGSPTAASMGRPWPELAAILGIDPDGEISTRTVVSGDLERDSVRWPVEGGDAPLMVELSGLPVLDRTKARLGYRGFGVCRDIAHLNALAESPRPHPRSDRPHDTRRTPPGATGRGLCGDAVAATAVVPEPKAPSLTPRERHAFLELSRRLSEGLNGLAGAAATRGGPATPAPADPPAALLQTAGIMPFSGKTDVLAALSHGIRTQLNAISGFSEVMMEGQFGPVGNERYRLYLMDIQSSASQLVALMNDLFALSNITSGDIDLSFKGVALNDVTQACLGLLQQRARRERTIVRSALAHRLPQVVADAPSVQQMVLNLLGNSIRSAGAGGQAIVTTALSDSGDVVLRVRDTGMAMTAKDISIALEPLRRLAVSARFGNGLELALTKALAEANHASFHITSEHNAGTLIEVTFPATQVLAR